jgi:hypothetical protein
MDRREGVGRDGGARRAVGHVHGDAPRAGDGRRPWRPVQCDRTEEKGVRPQGMRSVLALLGSLAVVAACMSQQMEGYVGQDIRAVMMDYGPPTGTFDLPDGGRAYQWTEMRSSTTPITTATEAHRRRDGRVGATSVTTGGETRTRSCAYTFMTVPNASRSGWTIVGFRRPSLECE